MLSPKVIETRRGSAHCGAVGSATVASTQATSIVWLVKALDSVQPAQGR
jgi:hypothetical protein